MGVKKLIESDPEFRTGKDYYYEVDEEEEPIQIGPGRNKLVNLEYLDGVLNHLNAKKQAMIDSIDVQIAEYQALKDEINENP